MKLIGIYGALEYMLSVSKRITCWKLTPGTYRYLFDEDIAVLTILLVVSFLRRTWNRRHLGLSK